MIRSGRTLLFVLLTALTALLAACGGGSNSSDTGTVTVGLTDAPVDDVLKLDVSFVGITAKPQNGKQISWTFSPPREIDLMSLQNGESEILLDNEELPAGPYNWIRLDINPEPGTSTAMLESNGQTLPIDVNVPSERLRFVSGFVVTADKQTAFMIDWDVRRSLSLPTGLDVAQLRPAWRVTDMATYASIGGTVADALVEDNPDTCDPVDPNDTNSLQGKVVYLYPREDGQDVAYDDIYVTDTADEGPMATTPVVWNADMTGYEYRFDYLPARDPNDPESQVRNYALAFTCQGASDEPGVQNDDMVFRSYVDVDDLVDGQDQLDANFVPPQ
jgi:hypothetical protein